MYFKFDKYLSRDCWSIILEKLPDNDCYYVIGKWDLIENACSYATYNKFYEVLIWAHGNGNIWNEKTCTPILPKKNFPDYYAYEAIMKDDTDYIKEALDITRKNGNQDILLKIRRKHKWFKICKYIIQYKGLKQIYCPENYEVKNFNYKL